MQLYHGDCLEIMKEIPDKSVDAIICDLPYSMTACEWDCLIPFDKLWEQYKRIRKDNTPIVLFGSEPFSSYLRMSNIKEYKYDWYWNKVLGGNFIQFKNAPVKNIECISIFCKSSPNYYPIMTEATDIRLKRNLYQQQENKGILNKVSNGIFKLSKNHDETKRYPKSLLTFNARNNECNNALRIHPTQKPVALLEYLIKTYSNEGDTILDNCMGSGTTGIAAYNTNRHFIGIEKDDTYFELAKERIENAMAQLKLF